MRQKPLFRLYEDVLYKLSFPKILNFTPFIIRLYTSIRSYSLCSSSKSTYYFDLRSFQKLDSIYSLKVRVHFKRLSQFKTVNFNGRKIYCIGSKLSTISEICNFNFVDCSSMEVISKEKGVRKLQPQYCFVEN